MFLCVSLARKAENPVFPTQAGLEMLKHLTLLLAPLPCAKIWLFLFGENGGMGPQRDRVSLIYSCSNGNVTSLWCHLESEILPWLCWPTPSPASPQPFCVSVGGMFSACTVLVQPTQIPDKVSIFSCFALDQTHRAQPHVEAAQDQRRAAGQRLLISAPWGTENHKSSAPDRVVILPHVSPKEQHDTCQDIKSTAFDALQQLGNENKQNASTGKLGHWKTSVEICWGFISPSFFF